MLKKLFPDMDAPKYTRDQVNVLKWIVVLVSKGKQEPGKTAAHCVSKLPGSHMPLWHCFVRNNRRGTTRCLSS